MAPPWLAEITSIIHVIAPFGGRAPGHLALLGARAPRARSLPERARGDSYGRPLVHWPGLRSGPPLVVRLLERKRGGAPRGPGRLARLRPPARAAGRGAGPHRPGAGRGGRVRRGPRG